MNRTLSSEHGRSLENTLTVPLTNLHNFRYLSGHSRRSFQDKIQMTKQDKVNICLFQSEIREIQKSIISKICDIFHSIFYCVQVLYTVHEQSANICIQGYFRILWIRNTKSYKKTKFTNVMFHV